MSNHKDNHKQKRHDLKLKGLSTEVFQKARSTLLSIGALKSRQERQEPQKKDKKTQERLKSSRSEPEFTDRKKHRSLIEQQRRDSSGIKPRPLSVGATKRYDNEFYCGSFSNDLSPILQRNFDSSEEICTKSRLVVPVNERLTIQDEFAERPRKKLSFREPEILGGGSATLGRSHKLMGVNSLVRRPNRQSVRSDSHYSSLEGLDSDLESQAMRIVRTVGQAFEVCHKMQANSPEEVGPSTSSAVEEAAPSDRGSDVPHSKEAASECGASESAVSTSKVTVEIEPEEKQRPTHLELLPPPPRKERRSPQRITRNQSSSVNLPELPECITKVEVTDTEVTGEGTPLSAQHQVQLLRERLEQQAQQTRAAVAQLMLLRDQLAAEQAARCEAQARTHQLLVHNKELLEHIAALVAHLQDRERGSLRPISAQQLTLLPQLSSSAKIDRWFSLLPSTTALSRPESGFVSGLEDTDAVTLAEARSLLLQLSAKKKRRFLPLRFRRKILVNKHTLV